MAPTMPPGSISIDFRPVTTPLSGKWFSSNDGGLPKIAYEKGLAFGEALFIYGQCHKD
jgi:hypothetical protein